MNDVTWKAITKTGQLICQEENGKYNNFLDYDHSQWICFTLFNKKNNSNYGIDLIKGCFLFNGLPVQPAIQSNIYDYPCVPNKQFNYGKTLFWYNQCIGQLNSNVVGSTCVSVFAGYTVQLNKDFTINGKSGKIKIARPCLKINSTNNVASFSTSYLFQYSDQNGNIIKVIG